MGVGFKKIGANFYGRAVLSKVEQSHAKVQARFGAYTRTVMRNSIKYKKGSAAPGSPPHAHRSERFTKEKTNKKTGEVKRQARSPLRELIFFARDPATNSVVIGPIPFGKRGARALEKGGTTTAKRRGKLVTVHIAPHPFAQPAGETAGKKLPDLLRQLVK